MHGWMDGWVGIYSFIAPMTFLLFLFCRGLKHINLCAFVGCIFEEHTSIQLTEFCSKRSLYDVLANSTLQLNWMFRLNFSADASRGLRYLHSKKILHTRLTMKNCVIDNRWRLKLTGKRVLLNLFELTRHYIRFSS